MSAEIIAFIPRLTPRGGAADLSVACRSTTRPDDLTMDHVDTAPCEYLWPCEEREAELTGRKLR